MKQTPHHDHANVVRRRAVRVSWVWFFPLLAVTAAMIFFWNNWRSNGPEVEIEFREAPGIEANKTLLFYRGVVSGKVTDVRLDKNLSKAIVTIRLKAFATSLSQSGTIYWIDQPVIGLAKTSGLSSLIQGNSIQARIGEGPKTTRFVGIDHSPLHPLESPGLILKLVSKNIPLLDEGSPVTYRGVTIGGIMAKNIDRDGNPYVIAAIEKQYVSVIHSNSHFWDVPPASLQLGIQGINLQLLNLTGLILGAVAVDCFEEPKESIGKDRAEFILYRNEAEAREENEGLMINLHAAEIPTIAIGSPVLYHGIIVGSVKRKIMTRQNEANLVVLIKKEFTGTVHQKSTFWRLPATSIQAGPGVLKVDVASLQSVIAGGIAYDNNKEDTTFVQEGASFELSPNEQVAHLGSQPLKLSFDDGQGLLAGETQVRYLGIPVGLVKEVKPVGHHIEVTLFFDTRYEKLLSTKMNYTIVRPEIGLHGISGLETLLSGIYIDCSPVSHAQQPVQHFFKNLFNNKKSKTS